MGACCGSSRIAPTETFTKGGPKDISKGPVKNRNCTDILCLILFLAHWGVFCFVTFLGLSDGNPSKLYKPRDYRGDYCDVKDQWNDGIDTEGFEKLSFTMNVSKTVELIALQLVCSSIAQSSLQSLLTPGELTTYRCACCLSACSTCYGSLPIDDLSNPSAASSTITNKMADLTGLGSAVNLFSAAGANGDFFTKMWDSATSYFNFVCLKKCNTPYKTNFSGITPRTYLYTPAPDFAWKRAWDVLATNSNVPVSIRNTINEKFTFQALPLDLCPYQPMYCVPFPGIEFTELEAGYCSFKMSKEVIDAVGSSAAEAFEELGLNDLQDGMSQKANNAAGDIMDSLDALLVVGIMALIIGLLFLVLLRFFTGCIVWFSLFAMLVIFAGSGFLLYIRSTQCSGATLWDTGSQMGSAAYLASAATVSGSTADESYTGNGKDYRGVQDHSKSGRTCQDWASQSPHVHSVNPSVAPYDTAGLEKNYCRNPTTAPQIWCFTTDPERKWEVCNPLGILRPECPQGFAVNSSFWRKFMEVLAWIIWGFGVLWIILICCLQSRIRLAIGINKAAAMFVYHTPQVLMVPLIQIFTSICWTFLWVLCASFLLSQVPDDYTPKGAYATYAEAYGTEDDPGACTNKAVSGFVWKTEGNLELTNDLCSGNKGDISAITPKCWRCAPPRFIIDWRFCISFCSFLWNKAFLIALGQTIIAGAVCAWFFAPRNMKTKTKSVRNAVWIAFRYHCGSIAFGAFILAVVQMLRWLAYYLERQAKAQKNRIMQYIMRCIQCCLWCLEKCIKFLNKNAYIQVAILGTDFCTSAKNAFMLIGRNFARFGVVATLGSVIHGLGYLFIMAVTTVLGYFVLQGLHPDIAPIIPVILYLIVSYVAAKLYMNVFGLAVDTMLQCFIATEEMGGDEDFVPSPLVNFIKTVHPDKSAKETKEIPE